MAGGGWAWLGGLAGAAEREITAKDKYLWDSLASRSDIPIGGVTTLFNGTSYVNAKIDQLFLGSRSSTIDTISYKGYLDDIRIYNRALSPDQIYQLYINNANSTATSSYTIPRSVIYNTPSIPPNTWRRVTFTIPGDTTGQWMTNNDAGLTLALCMGSGSLYATGNVAAASGNTVSVWNSVPEFAGTGVQAYGNSSNDFLGNIGNTVFVTGVQVEKGDVATPFELRPLGVELGLCQRYYLRLNNVNIGISINALDGYNSGYQLRPPCRIIPYLDASGTNIYEVSTGNTGTVALRNQSGLRSSTDNVWFYNLANNWTINAGIVVTCGLTAEI